MGSRARIFDKDGEYIKTVMDTSRARLRGGQAEEGSLIYFEDLWLELKGKVFTRLDHPRDRRLNGLYGKAVMAERAAAGLGNIRR